MKSIFKLSKLSAFVLLGIAQTASAAFIRADIDYQTYRDFAENKGRFTVGAQNVAIYNKQGTYLGTMLTNIPMVDFSSTDRNNAVATAVTNQYLAGVAHNAGYGSVSFGSQGTNPDAHHFDYLIVNRNDQDASWGLNTDYHLPRVHKLITEIVPIPMTNAGSSVATYANSSRFPLLLRVGAGVQKTRAQDGSLQDIADAYHSLLGGSSLDVTTAYSKSDIMWLEGNIYNTKFSPLATYGVPGDSGSPIYGYDTQEKRWVLVAVLRSYSGDYDKHNNVVINRPEYLKHLQKNDLGVEINNTTNNGVYTWTANGKTSTIKMPSGKNLSLNLADTSLTDSNTAHPSLDYGKNLSISGSRSAILNLANDINQGAGAIYINANVTVRSNNDSTWQGAGVTVEKGKRVDWQVKNPKGDRLSKLGEGEFWVNGSGENLGDLSVGDGLVVLAQQADRNGKQQAFNSVGIVSGRPTVRLDAANQLNPNNIYFGYRGGRLDLNGQSLTFNHIQNIDDGAHIVNNNASNSSNITITGKSLYNESDLQWGNWREFSKDIYEYPYGKNTYYLALKNNPYMYYPTNGISNNDWEVLSTNDKQAAVNKVLSRKNAQLSISTYNGYFGETNSDNHNGELNVTFAPTGEHTLVLSGGTNLNGKLTAKGGTLLLNGIPTPHAYNTFTNSDVVYEDDWINRSFTTQNLVVENNAKVFVGRNVTALNANISASNNASLHLGFEQGKSLNCYYSTYTGDTNCQEQAVLSSQNFANLPTTQITGNTTLSGSSSLRLGKAHLYGSIQASQATNVELSSNAIWTNTADSKIGNLVMEQGSTLNLNSNYAAGLPNRFNSLIIDGDLSGNGQFNYLTNAATGKGDHVKVNGKTDGIFVLALKNSGAEPRQSTPLSLLTLNHSQENNATVTLANGYVDLGAYRYILANQNSDYRLYSPLKAVQEQNPNFIDPAAAELEVQKALENAQQQYQNISTLNAQIASQQQAVQSAQAALTAAQNRLQEAQQELGKLKWINIVKRAKLNHEISELNTTIASTQALLSQQTQTLSSSQQLLANAQELASQADKALEDAKSQAEIAKNTSKQQIQAACLSSGASIQSCQILTTAEGLELETDTTQRNWTSMYANAALSEFSAQAQGMLQIGRSLDRQLFNHSDKASVWAATDYQRTTRESHLYRPYKQTATLSQVGVEMPLANGFSLGAVFSHHHAKNDFDDYLTGKGKMNVATLYTKYRTQYGTFFGLDAHYGKAKNELDNVKFHRSYTALGVNLGHEFDISGINVQPTIGARFYRLGQASYNLLDAEVSTPAQHFTAYQAGVKASKTFGEQWKITPSLAVHYVNANQRKMNVEVNGHRFTQRFGQYLHSEAGVELHNQNWQIGFNAGLINGNEIHRQRFAGAKVSYSW